MYNLGEVVSIPVGMSGAENPRYIKGVICEIVRRGNNDDTYAIAFERAENDPNVGTYYSQYKNVAWYFADELRPYTED